MSDWRFIVTFLAMVAWPVFWQLHQRRPRP